MVIRKFNLFILLILFITLISDLNSQTVILSETDSELIEENDLVYDTVNNKVQDLNEKTYPSKYRFGIELKYPFIHGGDDDDDDFWKKLWDGIFDLSADFNIILIKNLGIGPTIDISLYKTNFASLNKYALLMIITAFSTKYDFVITPNKSMVFTPFINIGLSTNCFYQTYDNKGEWSNDLGFIFSLGSSIKIRLPNEFEIGPIFRYDVIRRFYNISEGYAIDKSWIEKIKNLLFGIKVNIPIIHNKNNIDILP